VRCKERKLKKGGTERTDKKIGVRKRKRKRKRERERERE
jgi:hypothetical protein